MEDGPTTRTQRLAVLIPCYNERATLELSVNRVIGADLPDGVAREILIVDDGSTDGSVEIGERLATERQSVRHLSLGINRGKGAAIREGLKKIDADIVLIHDADLEYDPNDHDRVLAPILDGRADAVIGTRFGGQTHRVLYYWHSLANRLVSALAGMAADLNLSDIECCTKAFRKDILDRIDINEEGFGVEPELVIKVGRMRTEDGSRLRVYEVPVSYDGRTYDEGKKIRGRDGVWALLCIARYGFAG